MEKLIIVTTYPELVELVSYLDDKTLVAYDTETTGLSGSSEIIGLSVCAEVGVAYYVVLKKWDSPTKALVDTSLAGSLMLKNLLLTLKSKQLIMHNAVFDCWMTANNFDVSLIQSVHTDTMILAHVTDENRPIGLKELGVALFGADAKKEQEEMKASISANGGSSTKGCYELYKADWELIARYGAKDALLTWNVFLHLVPDLYEQGLEKFFYEDECMPLLRGPTYDLNTSGLKVDVEKLQQVKTQIEAECMELKAFIYKEIQPHIAKVYPGTNAKNTFNIGSGKQLAWLLYDVLGNDFNLLTDEGKEVCKALGLKLPYAPTMKRLFKHTCKARLGQIWRPGYEDPRTGKKTLPRVVKEAWNYMSTDSVALNKLTKRHLWVAKLLEHSKNVKILSTYVKSIQEKMTYGIIRPSFRQAGTSSGRYSSSNPNFQNLPRKDKRIKGCIIAREGSVFVGADYSQLEPRVFASFSKDERLLKCFSTGDDFYSVIGVDVFNKQGLSLKKDEPNSFASKHPDLRDIAKVVSLSSAYGTTAPKMAMTLNCPIDQAQEIIDNYFESFPKVLELMLDSHKEVKAAGKALSLFGRPRRLPAARHIPKGAKHESLPYEARTLLNLGMNHRIQSTAASIMNRAAIMVYNKCRELESVDPAWASVKIASQVHDELILEGPEHLGSDMVLVLKFCMENCTTLPGVDLIAEPKIAKNFADLK